MTDDEFNAWPKCVVPACTLKCCRALASRFCWPHTPGTPEQAAESLVAERDELELPA